MRKHIGKLILAVVLSCIVAVVLIYRHIDTTIRNSYAQWWVANMVTLHLAGAVRPPTYTGNRMAHCGFDRIQLTTRSKPKNESSQSREVASYSGDRSAGMVGLHSLVRRSASTKASLVLARIGQVEVFHEVLHSCC